MAAPEPVGDWLFKQDDMLLGPVPGKVLVEKLYRGEISAQTPVAREGQDDFVPIESVEAFRVHAKKASVKVQIDRETSNFQIAEKKKTTSRLVAFGVLGVVVLGAGSYGAYELAVKKPWRHTNEADLVAIEIDPPTISLTAAHDDAVAVEIPSANPTTPGASPGGKHPVLASHTTKRAPTPGAGPQTDGDGMSSGLQVDTASIQQAANSKAGTLKSCILAEAKANNGEPGRVKFEFTVQNDGRVGKVWVDGDYASPGEFHDCLLRTVQGWTFAKYQGEQANVTLGFSWGAKH